MQIKLILKIGKLVAAIIFAAAVILLSASYLLKDKVGFIILRSLNKNLSTKLEVGSYKLSFLKKFPNASLELKDVLVHSSPDFNRSAFKGINTDTLLSTKTVSLEFRITDIIKGVYNIERIGARSGRANFFTDTEGHVNYNISVKNSSSGGEGITIDLRRINVTDIYAYYNSLTAHLVIGGPLKNGRLKSKIVGSTIDFTGESDLEISLFQLFDFKTDKTIPAKIKIDLQSTKSGIMLRSGSLYIDNFDIGIKGYVGVDNILDLNLAGHDLDLAKIRKYLPQKYMKMIEGYDPSGIFNATSKIKGLLSKNSNPHVEISWQLRSGKVSYSESNLAFKDISFTGHFSNGPKNNSETGIISINGFKGRLGSSEYTGDITLKNFKSPLYDISLKGRMLPSELKEFFNISQVSTADGSVDLDLKLVNCNLSSRSFSMNGFIDMKPQSDLKFNSFTLGLDKDKYLFKGVTGSITIQNSLIAKNIQFNYKGQNIKIDGEFRNLIERMTGRNLRMSGTASVTVDRLVPEAFFGEASSSARVSHNQRAIKMPDDIDLDINFRFDSLNYKTFSSSRIIGSMNYKPGLLTIKSIRMRSLNGLVSGSCYLARSMNKGFMAKGNFIVDRIDVNKAFRSFSNFGQSFLKAENIKGTLSGSLSLVFPLDSLLKFNIKTLTAEGNYHLVNGALINFDPVKQLSTFIELSELENINFDQLNNDFFIRNNYLYIPQMEVKSSAADLSVNGKHSFDNDYEYHVKILLSQILSRKRSKYKSNVTEFGVVEDDGLGRTSLLLRIAGKGEVAKVGYDMKAAGAEVKNNIKKEKQTLKTILNQEYGWYKGDSSLSQKPAEKKSRFKISWDDNDTVKVKQSPPPEKSENTFKNLFKKK
jgi:hypothetical protein